MNKNNLNEKNPFWEGWDDENVWYKIDQALRLKRRKRYIFLFAFPTLIGLSFILYILSQEKIPIIKTFDKEYIDCPINAERRPLTNNKVHISCSKNREINQFIPSKKSNNILENNLNIVAKSFLFTSNIDKNKVQNQTEYDLRNNDKDKFYPQTLNSNEIFSNLNNTTFISSELEKVTTSLILLPESSKNENGVIVSNAIDILNNPLTLPINVSKKSHKSFLAFQFFSSMGIGRRTDYFDENIEWYKLKHNNETYLYSIANSFLISKSLNTNCKFNIGVGYTSHISKLIGTNISIEKTIVLSDSARFQNINGTYHYFNGNLIKTTTTKQNYQVINLFSIFQIPFSISYVIPRNKYQLLFSLGSQFNIYNKFNGYSYNELSIIEKINTLPKNNFQGNIGLKYITTSIGYSRNIYSKIALIMEMGYFIPLSVSYVQGNPKQQTYKSKYTYGQFNLGIQYRLK